MNYTKIYKFMNEYVNINDIDSNNAYNINIDNLVCPCCKKRLRLVDSLKNDYNINDDLIKINESIINENKLADYLMDIIAAEAKDIYQNELDTNEPEVDTNGEIIETDYNERFIYVPASLKKVIKMKSNAISNMIKAQGYDVSPAYIETELFQCIKSLGRTSLGR